MSNNLNSNSNKDIKVDTDTGIHTVEGSVAGFRAVMLSKQREQQKAEYENVKNKIKESNASGLKKMDEKFRVGVEGEMDEEFRKRTVGLVTADEFRKTREDIGSWQVELARQAEVDQLESNVAKQQFRDSKRKLIASKLSFSEDAEELDAPVIKKLAKDPTIDTSFLPDKERDRKLELEKERIRKEWMEKNELAKKEKLEVVYSYWDGFGHRKSIIITKGTSIGKFLEQVKADIVHEFPDLRAVGAESLLYVKEDLIIPHHITFQDLIVTKARGKSGPLFHFDVHDDVRLINDVRIEKDESHPGKVVQRRWYEANKHIFPASRWEFYNPSEKRDSQYTIKG